MKILLLNIDSKLPNIALKKVEMWHRQQGNEVILDMPMMLNQVDMTYVSCIFTRNYPKVANYKGLRPDTIVGGTGTWGFIDPPPRLPKEIELVKPKINYGFTTRGCIRKCPFCLVPKLEGDIRVVGDIFDIWDSQSKTITLLDNNILALPEHFVKICSQISDNKLIVDFNQGLDIRLITKELGEYLANIKTKDIRFAFDHPKLEHIVRDKIATLRRIKRLENKAFSFMY